MTRRDQLTRDALAARSGDPAATASFISDSHADVWRLCAHLVDQQSGVDLTQEAHLCIQRRTERHIVSIDDLTHTLAIDWLRRRHRRWPITDNPHLLVTQETVANATIPPIALTVMDAHADDTAKPAGPVPAHRKRA